jgi:hypothetical protein
MEDFSGYHYLFTFNFILESVGEKIHGLLANEGKIFDLNNEKLLLKGSPK